MHFLINKNCERVLPADCSGRKTKGCSLGLREIAPDKHQDPQEEVTNSETYVFKTEAVCFLQSIF